MSDDDRPMRYARDFDRDQARDWFMMAAAARAIEYWDRSLPKLLEDFGIAIARQQDVALSRPTEARISKLHEALRASSTFALVNHRGIE